MCWSRRRRLELAILQGFTAHTGQRFVSKAMAAQVRHDVCALSVRYRRAQPVGATRPSAEVSIAMVIRITSAVVVLIIVLATAATLLRVYTAPERIQKRLETAKAVCKESGGLWTFDAERNPICSRN